MTRPQLCGRLQDRVRETDAFSGDSLLTRRHGGNGRRKVLGLLVRHLVPPLPLRGETGQGHTRAEVRLPGGRTSRHWPRRLLKFLFESPVELHVAPIFLDISLVCPWEGKQGIRDSGHLFFFISPELRRVLAKAAG